MLGIFNHFCIVESLGLIELALTPSRASALPARIIVAVNSWGNVCGQKNDKLLVNQSNSGLDLTDRKYVAVAAVNILRASNSS